MATDFTTWTIGGDEVQQRRRQLMVDSYARPEYWLGLCETAFIHAMRRTGNAPDRELANIVGFLVKAAEYGAQVGNGVLADRLAGRIDAELPDLGDVWRVVAVAVEALAVQRIAAHDEAAKIEAIASMGQSPV